MEILKTEVDLWQNNNIIVVDEFISSSEVQNKVFIDGNLITTPDLYGVYKVNSLKDTVQIEYNNGAIDTVSSLVSYTLGNNIENLILEDVVQRKIIDSEYCIVYGNATDERWCLDDIQEDTGIVKLYKGTPIPFEGCCGIVSVENILIMAGKITNTKDLRYTSNISGLDSMSCDMRQDAILRMIILYYDTCKITGHKKEQLGALEETQSNIGKTIQSVLAGFGINSDIIRGELNILLQVTEALKMGKGVILSINTLSFNNSLLPTPLKANHYITVNGVVYTENNILKGFYICDSANADTAKYISYMHLARSLAVDSVAIITTEPLKNVNNDINGEGNELDNTIEGNSGNNILIGGLGLDTIRGGAGDDFIFGGTTIYTTEEIEAHRASGYNNLDLSMFAYDDYQVLPYGEVKTWNYLYGGEGNDILIACNGDKLEGNEGDDILVFRNGKYTMYSNGGTGYDTYFIDKDVESIALSDSDKLGAIIYDGVQLQGSNDFQVADGVWYDDLGNRYEWNGVNGTTLTINGKIKIGSYTNGYLGIVLNRFTDELRLVDPLVIDLNNNGIELISTENSNAYFDINGDGIREKLQWVNPNDGFLVLDKDNNGEINGIDELFGNTATIGFEDLKQYDINNDNVIDANDVKFSQLKVWQDLNSNGVVDENELKSLSDVGITKINLNYEEGENATFAEKSTVEFADGSSSVIQDINLEVNFANTKYEAPANIPDEIKTLPQLKGAGLVKDLYSSMIANPDLKTFVENLVTKNPVEILNSMDEFLKQWSGIGEISNDVMRGNCPKFLADIVEKFYNDKFVDENYSGEISDDIYNSKVLSSFMANYKQIKNKIYSALIVQTDKLNCLSAVSYNSETGKYTLSGTKESLSESIKTYLLTASDIETVALGIVLDMLRTDYVFDFDVASLGEEYSDRQKLLLSNHYKLGTNIASEYNDIVFATEDGMTITDYYGSDIYIMQNGDNNINDRDGINEFYLGSGNDTVNAESSQGALVYAGAGNDNIYISGSAAGTSDKKIAEIYGEDGDDNINVSDMTSAKIYGGTGDDTIQVSNIKETIIDSGVGDDNITVSLTSASYATIDSGEGNDNITLQSNQGTSILKSGSGTDIITEYYGKASYISAGEDNDELKIYYSEDSYIKGDGGNDNILINQSQNITVEGGTGNDTVDFEESSGTYIFNSGDGEDSIYLNNSSGKSCTLKFGEGITWDDLIFESVHESIPVSWDDSGEHDEQYFNLSISIKDSNDKLIIKYWFGGANGNYDESKNYRFENFVFSDGSIYSPEDIVLESDKEVLPTIEDNIYTYNLGDKQLIIRDYYGNDKIVFGENITANDLEIYRVEHDSKMYPGSSYWEKQDSDDLLIKVKDSDGEILILNYYSEVQKEDKDGTVIEYPHEIEILEFANGSTLNKADIENLRIIPQNPWGEYIVGKDGNNTYNLNGNDYVIDPSGNDTYYSSYDNQYIIDKETKQPLDIAEKYSEEKFGTYEQYEVYLKSLLGNDTYNLGSGDDTIIDSSSGHDVIYAGAGDDKIYLSGSGSANVYAEAGNDIIDIRDREFLLVSGGYGDDSIILNNINSANINGDYGDDSIEINNSSNSTVYGGSGNDNIVINNSENISVYNDIDSVTVKVKDSSDISLSCETDYNTITIENSNNTSINLNSENNIIYNNDSDGTTITGSNGDGSIQINNSDNVNLSLTSGNNSISASNSNNSQYYAGNGNDNIRVYHSENSKIAGGKGNDNIKINDSNVTIEFNLGDGEDILLLDNNTDNICTLKFGEGISWDDLEFSQLHEVLNASEDEIENENSEVSESLVIKIKGTNDKITIRYWLGGNNGDYNSYNYYQIDNFLFADGSVYTKNEIPGTTFIGTDEDETITGTNLNDTYNMKGGNDVITDNGGNDTYIFNRGDGKDIITDLGGNDTIVFGENITLNDLIFIRAKNPQAPDIKDYYSFDSYEETVFYDDLIIKIKNTDDELRIKKYYYTDNPSYYTEYLNRIETIQFADGSSIGAETIENLREYNLTSGDDYIYGLDGNNTYNLEGADTVIEISGNDVYNSTSGNQYIIDKESKSYWDLEDEYSESDFANEEEYEAFLHSLIGNDTYNLGTGNDTVIDVSNGNDNINTGAGNDTVIVSSEAPNEKAVTIVHTESGDDNIKISYRSNVIVSGGTGNDIIDIENIYRDTTILFNKGDGQDILTSNTAEYYDDSTSKIKFGEGITWADLIFERQKVITKKEEWDIDGEYAEYEDNLIIKIKNTDDQITIRYWFGGNNGYNLTPADFKIDTFEFYDGTSKTKDDILLEAMSKSFIEGTDSDDTLTGTANNDVFYGKQGNDTIVDSYDSNDMYLFNKGDGQDTITDNGGDDVIIFGENITQDDILLTKNNNDLIISINDSEDSITIKDWGLSYNNQIETFKFADYSVMNNINSLIQNYIGTDADDTIVGNTKNNLINGGAGADTMIGDLGNDTYIVDNVNDIVVEQENEGTDTILSSVTYALPDNVENLTLTGSDNINGTGNSLDNIIIGNDGANVISGGVGNDTLYGGSGNDKYLFELNDGVDSINDLSGDNDIIQLGQTIDKSQIAIYKDGNNLIIDYGNSLGKDKITVMGHFDDSSTKQIEKIELSDASYMDIEDINMLIENMTAYAQNNAIEFTGIDSVKNNADLMNLVASSWHS